MDTSLSPEEVYKLMVRFHEDGKADILAKAGFVAGDQENAFAVKADFEKELEPIFRLNLPPLCTLDEFVQEWNTYTPDEQEETAELYRNGWNAYAELREAEQAAQDKEYCESPTGIAVQAMREEDDAFMDKAYLRLKQEGKFWSPLSVDERDDVKRLAQTMISEHGHDQNLLKLATLVLDLIEPEYATPGDYDKAVRKYLNFAGSRDFPIKDHPFKPFERQWSEHGSLARELENMKREESWAASVQSGGEVKRLGL